MSIPSRVAPRLRSLHRAVPPSARPFTTTIANRKEEQWPQRFPIGKFYESVLNHPTPYPFEQKPEEPPNSADPKVLPEDKEPVPVKKPEPTKTEEKPEPTKTQDKKSESESTGERPAKRKPGRPKKNAAATASTSVPTPSPTSPPTPAHSPEEKVRIIFGTRLASPDDKEARLNLKASGSTYIAGVMVPPEPAEPDNCCMSGCVNCVWELYREDMEEFTAKKVEAQKRLQAQSGSVEADGDGSETSRAPTPPGVKIGEAKIAKDMWDEDVFANVPVGIREFMKHEKRLKERHEREGTVG